MSSKTCRAELKRLINEKVVASCSLFTSLYVNEPSSPIKCWVFNLIKHFICDKIQAYEADISCELYFVLRLWCDVKWGTVTSG